MKKASLIGALAMVVILVGAYQFMPTSEEANTDSTVDGSTKGEMADNSNQDTDMKKDYPQYDEVPEVTIDTSKKYSAVLKTTEGDVVVALNASETPVTVNNFVFLANEKFYNDTIFHRVIDGFMIQGGDPTGTGTGSPGYRFEDEPFEGEYSRGTVAMANSGPDTNGSQFFIMHGDVELPPDYVIFGTVEDGMDVVDKIATAPTKTSFSGEKSTPVKPVTITSVEITQE